jgi:periplasmic divalent cation tolerance protein
MTNGIVILVTAGSETEAETIARALVEERLAACVNILNPIRSIYRWEERSRMTANGCWSSKRKTNDLLP